MVIIPKHPWILHTHQVKRSLSDLLRRDVCLWHHFVWNICTYMYRWFIQWLKGAFRVVEPYLTTRSQNAYPPLFTYNHSLGTGSVHSTGRLVNYTQLLLPVAHAHSPSPHCLHFLLQSAITEVGWDSQCVVTSTYLLLPLHYRPNNWGIAVGWEGHWSFKGIEDAIVRHLENAFC